jgi:hypothetical protein
MNLWIHIKVAASFISSSLVFSEEQRVTVSIRQRVNSRTLMLLAPTNKLRRKATQGINLMISLRIPAPMTLFNGKDNDGHHVVLKHDSESNITPANNV